MHALPLARRAPRHVRTRRATLALAALALFAGCGPQDASRDSVPPGPGSALAPAPLPVNARDVLALAARPGARATLVNVWATWCGPCREEFPALLAAAGRHRAEGLRLVLVSADFEDSLAQVRRFLGARGWTDTSYIKAQDDMAFIDELEPRWSGALPATFVFDGTGRPVAFWEGAADEARFEDAIRRALESGPSPQGGRP